MDEASSDHRVQPSATTEPLAGESHVAIHDRAVWPLRPRRRSRSPSRAPCCRAARAATAPAKRPASARPRRVIDTSTPRLSPGTPPYVRFTTPACSMRSSSLLTPPLDSPVTSCSSPGRRGPSRSSAAQHDERHVVRPAPGSGATSVIALDTDLPVVRHQKQQPFDGRVRQFRHGAASVNDRPSPASLAGGAPPWRPLLAEVV